MDQFKEQLVRAQNVGKYKIVKILMYILGVLALLSILTGNFMLGLLLVVIAGILFYV